MLDPAQTIALLERVVHQFIGHASFSRQKAARRLANRMVDFVISEIERASADQPARHRPLPTTSGWLDFLQEVVDGGLPSYDSQADEVIVDLVGRLHAALTPEGKQLLLELEAAFNARTERWAEDRFGLGVIVGRSSLADLMTEGPLG